MSPADEAFTSNLLLNALASSDLALLEPHLRRVTLHRAMVLSRANELIEAVYFLENGIASIVSNRPDSGRTEVGIFGFEGMSGTSRVMGVDRSPHETFIQGDGGTALRIERGQ